MCKRHMHLLSFSIRHQEDGLGLRKILIAGKAMLLRHLPVWLSITNSDVDARSVIRLKREVVQR